MPTMVSWLKQLIDDEKAEIIGEVSFFSVGCSLMADGHLYREADRMDRIKGAALAVMSGTVDHAVARIADVMIPVDLNGFSVVAGGEITMIVDRMPTGFAAAVVRAAMGRREAERPRTWRELPPML